MREAVTRFTISNESIVRHWVNVYKPSDQKGLPRLKRGRSKAMSKPLKTSPLTDAALEKLLPEELRVEFRYLRAAGMSRSMWFDFIICDNGTSIKSKK